MTMPNLKVISSRVLLGLAAVLLTLASTVAAQTSTARTSGAPLKGVDVKLGRYSGAQFSAASAVASTKTDDKGHFVFPVLPRGQYVLTVSLPAENSAAKPMTQRGAAEAAPRFGIVTLNLANGKQITMGYDFTQAKAFDATIDPADTAAMKAAKFAPFVFTSDGTQPCNGTIVKSKSNITNN
jgi:hypothetical protein